MHVMVAKNGSAVITADGRMKLPMNENPVNAPKIIETLQAARLHGSSAGPGSIIRCFFHDPEIHTPPSHLAGESKAGRASSNDEDRYIRFMDDSNVHRAQSLNSVSSLTLVMASRTTETLCTCGVPNFQLVDLLTQRQPRCDGYMK